MIGVGIGNICTQKLIIVRLIVLFLLSLMNYKLMPPSPPPSPPPPQCPAAIQLPKIVRGKLAIF